MTVAIQGCGFIGAAVARTLSRAGLHVIVADALEGRARKLAAELGADVLPTDQTLYADVDIIYPCAVGQMINRSVVEGMRAWGICGGANNQLAHPEISALLMARDILYIPDFLASAGAVSAGTAVPLMNADPDVLLAATFVTAQEILLEAQRTRLPTHCVAEARARSRIAAVARSS